MRKWEKLPDDNNNDVHRHNSLKYHKNNNIINDYDQSDLITINFTDDINNNTTIDDNNNNNNSNSNSNNDDNKESNNSSVMGATMNFINSIVGAGIIGIPFAISQTGFFMGLILLFLIAYLINRSVIMLIECGLERNKLNLEELCEHLLGIKGYYLALGSMMMFAYGGMLAYLIIFGDTMPFVIQTIFNSQNIILSRESVMIISATFIILPLCLMKNIESLAWTSSFSVLSDIILVLILVIGAPIAAKNQGIVLDISQLVFARSTMFAGLGTISFAFVCQHNSFLVFRSLKEPTYRNWSHVAHGSVIVSFIVCSTFGLAGFLNFLDQTKGNVLDNFSESDKAISVARFFLAICMILTYPMECFVARHCLLSILNKYFSNRENNKFCKKSSSLSYSSKKLANEDISDDTTTNSIVMSSLHDEKCANDDNDDNDNDIQTTSESSKDTSNIFNSNLARILSVVFLWSSTLIIAVIATDLSIVLAITGSIAASCLGYTIPGIVYIKTYDGEFNDMINNIIINKTITLNYIKKFGLPIFMIIFGLLSLFIGLITVLFFDPNE